MIRDTNIKIDRDICIACGICVDRCVMDNLRLSVAPCRQGCPLHINCQGVMKLIAQGKEQRNDVLGAGGLLIKIKRAGTVFPANLIVQLMQSKCRFHIYCGDNIDIFKDPDNFKGVEFHNGKTMDAEDVIFSLNRHRDKDSKSVAKAYFKSVTNMKADGKYRIIVDLNSGNADFPFFMADSHAAIVPSGTTNFNECIGTGGYILKDFNPGVRSFVKRNPNYWKSERAHFDEIEILAIPDTNARTSALRTRTIDAMNHCDLKTADLLKKKPGIEVIQMTGAKHYTFPMRTDLAPYNNNDTRLALKYAIDREQLLKIVLRGYGSVGNDTPIGPTYQYYAKDLPQRSYDPDKAKFHLKKAGLMDHTFTIHASNAAFAGGEEAALLYSEQARKAGLKIKIKREPRDGYWKNIWMKKPWSMSYYSGKPTEDWIFSQAYSIESKWNETLWTNKRFNELLTQARSETKDDKRRQMYGEMQHILWSEGGTIIPIFADFVDATSDKVQHAELSGNFALDGYRCSERWWFKG